MDNTKQYYKKVNTELLQALLEVIANSKTNLTFLQMQQLFEQVQNSEDIVESDDESKGEVNKKSNTTKKKE